MAEGFNLDTRFQRNVKIQRVAQRWRRAPLLHIVARSCTSHMLFPRATKTIEMRNWVMRLWPSLARLDLSIVDGDSNLDFYELSRSLMGAEP